MKVIGIVSDTHRRLPDAVLRIFRGGYDDSQVLKRFDVPLSEVEIRRQSVDRIIHAGDIGSQKILDVLQEVAPVHAVLGNCDSEEYKLDGVRVRDELLELNIDGLMVAIMHDPADLARSLKATNSHPDLVIHGHTHDYRINPKADSIGLCPGSVADPRNDMGYRTVALVYVEGPQIMRIEIVHL